MGTDSGGLSKYNPQNDRFEHFRDDKSNPQDRTVALYHSRSTASMVSGVTPDWAGTERMQTK